MPDDETEDDSKKEWLGRPLARRQKPIPRSTSPNPTSQELFRAHQLSQQAAVESPEELAKRLSRLREGLEGIDDDPNDLHPAS